LLDYPYIDAVILRWKSRIYHLYTTYSSSKSFTVVLGLFKFGTTERIASH
jgi:hypothetical protein